MKKIKNSLMAKKPKAKLEKIKKASATVPKIKKNKILSSSKLLNKNSLKEDKKINLKTIKEIKIKQKEPLIPTNLTNKVNKQQIKNLKQKENSKVIQAEIKQKDILVSTNLPKVDKNKENKIKNVKETKNVKIQQTKRKYSESKEDQTENDSNIKSKITKTEPKTKQTKKVKSLKVGKKTKTDSNPSGKLSDSTTENISIPNGLTISKKTVLECVEKLLKQTEDKTQNKKAIFSSDDSPIFLQVTCIKIPTVPTHQLRLLLRHSLVSPEDSVALFVADLQRGRRRDYEDTVAHYEDLLQEKNVKRINAIIPFNQVKTEYNQYELRRRLVFNHDHFLVDGKISGHLAHCLGKIFTERRKLPVSIRMNSKDLKHEVDHALHKTCMKLHGSGDCNVMQIGTPLMGAEKIAENIVDIANQLASKYPGGWENIRGIRIKTAKSSAVPIYSTLKNSRLVAVPVIKPKRMKKYRDVEGELSTINKNIKVTMTPEGTVKIVKLKTDANDKSNASDESDDDENEESENEE